MQSLAATAKLNDRDDDDPFDREIDWLCLAVDQSMSSQEQHSSRNIAHTWEVCPFCTKETHVLSGVQA